MFAMMRVVSNLVSNAIKNTGIGGILIGARTVRASIVIDVLDTGAGIDQKALTKPQQPFMRDAEYDGSGLGLNIIRELCNEHSFGFYVCSKPNVG